MNINGVFELRNIYIVHDTDVDMLTVPVGDFPYRVSFFVHFIGISQFPPTRSHKNLVIDNNLLQ